MALTPGTRLGPYEILSPIGAGGMGEVYKANDTRLDRTVAIKVLPEHLAESPERKARFEREAKAISQLNHPHICTLYDVGEQDGIDFIVMEYIEGETLAERLQKGALPLEHALQVGVEVADALDKAHRQGVVHRDLKPGNVMLTKGGAKLLDFGLAKQLDAQQAPTLSALPTKEKPLTEEGVILGTLQYMAPEQLEGKEADARTDIFAFGNLLYEMVTGKKAFNGESQASLIGAILKDKPGPISSAQPMSPPAFNRLVTVCLAKDPEDRWQSAADLTRELTWVRDQPAETSTHAPVVHSWSRWAAPAIVLFVLTVGVWVLFFGSNPADEPNPPVRFAVTLPPTDRFAEGAGLPVAVAVSPDGRRAVYAARREGIDGLYVRALDELEAFPLPGAAGAIGPFFSPDGEWLGLYADGLLQKLPLAGGSPIPIAPVRNFFGASWSERGTIVYHTWSSPLMMVSEDGGAPEPVTHFDEGRGETSHRDPHVLPDGNALLFEAHGGIEVIELETGERQFVVEGRSPHYTRSGHLVFARGESVLAAPFDLETQQLSGPAVTLVDGVVGGQKTHFSISPNGTLAYLSAAEEAGGILTLVDREGRSTPVSDESRSFTHPRLSPDGARIVVDIVEPGGREAWVYERTRGTSYRLAASVSRPIWTPDGTHVTFQRDRRLYTIRADGRDEPELLLEQDGFGLFPLAWSPVGDVLAYSAVRGDTSRNVWILPRSGEPEPYLNSVLDERAAMFSPDGKWVVYAVREQGVPEQIYIQPYPGPGERTVVSANGGMEPVWSPTGREIFYRSVDGRKMFVVSVELSPALLLGVPEELFEGRFGTTAVGFWSEYDVTRDGQELLMVKLGDTATTHHQLHVIVNALGRLK